MRNNFYLGAYQSAISEASQLTGLSEAEKIERDVFVYRAYIELGSHEVRGGERARPPTTAPPARLLPLPPAFATALPTLPRCAAPAPSITHLVPRPPPPMQLVMSEINSSSPAALQAVRALALYAKQQREAAMEQVASWMSDPACASNPTVLLIAGLLYALEENYVEALRACHTGGSLEM